ncbi:MAG: 1-acyl-sn-glycerol-3-phosphate acyltransferase [Clostridia bacterium]|nr:1-acyl-sn-glycerol-3-phosphate acyltransferase [Clostridia bacterium]
MKIKVKKLDFEQVQKLKRPKRKKPSKPSGVLKLLIRAISHGALKNVNFTYDFPERDTVGKGPYLILMNHSSFLDLKIVSKIFKREKYNIVCTTDALVGKEFLMRKIGCVPTQKFVRDVALINDISYIVKKQKNSVLMYPEAGYSLDGSATPIPEGLGRLIKMLGVPVIFVKTFGAYHHDPLYNLLQLRKVDVSATVTVLASKEEVENLTVNALSEKVQTAFTFDNFKWQIENGVKITEKFRADGLERVLYKCPACNAEGHTVGKGITLKCNACGKEYTLTEYGQMQAVNGMTEYPHIPDWYNWQRECVKGEITDWKYQIETDVKLLMLVDYKRLYDVGEAVLTHDKSGFSLVGKGFPLNYRQGPLTSYSLNSDYYWYEMGDVVSIGDKNALYYCFPKKDGLVSKLRLATEEIYKIAKSER